MNSTFIIFGASGDLTSRKLIPALYELFRKSRLPKKMRILGLARTEYTSPQWREQLQKTSKTFLGHTFHEQIWNTFSQMIHYFPCDVTKPDAFHRLRAHLETLEEHEPSERIYYMAMSPLFYEGIILGLGEADLAQEMSAERRIVVEKPFGRNLESARHLNKVIHQVFQEKQIYRIDHYLGKETVNNVMVLRFANAIFEPLWNRNYIEYIQITANEKNMVGRRANYYEQAGVLRDMFQNHLLQLMTLTAMEPPSRFEANSIRDEKVKVLRAVRLFSGEMPLHVTDSDFIFGQYRSYRDTPGVSGDSRVPTYAALRLLIDNWRWKDVPFYLRSAKATSCATTQIVIQFRKTPHSMFSGTPVPADGNRMVIQIQPAEGIQIHFQSKVPDTELKIRHSEFQFNFNQNYHGEMPDAYERLLLDILHSDPSLFARSDEVEVAWQIIDPIQNAWDDAVNLEPYFYEAGSWGPDCSNAWIEQFGHEWFNLCPLF